MLRSLDFGLGLKTFANFLRVSVSVSENLVSEKKSRYRFQKIWYRKKSLGIGFGKFGIGKKYRYRFRSNFWYRHSVLRINAMQFTMQNVQSSKCYYQDMDDSGLEVNSSWFAKGGWRAKETFSSPPSSRRTPYVRSTSSIVLLPNSPILASM